MASPLNPWDIILEDEAEQTPRPPDPPQPSIPLSALTAGSYVPPTPSAPQGSAQVLQPIPQGGAAANPFVQSGFSGPSTPVQQPPLSALTAGNDQGQLVQPQQQQPFIYPNATASVDPVLPQPPTVQYTAGGVNQSPSQVAAPVDPSLFRQATDALGITDPATGVPSPVSAPVFNVSQPQQINPALSGPNAFDPGRDYNFPELEVRPEVDSVEFGNTLAQGGTFGGTLNLSPTDPLSPVDSTAPLGEGPDGPPISRDFVSGDVSGGLSRLEQEPAFRRVIEDNEERAVRQQGNIETLQTPTSELDLGDRPLAALSILGDTLVKSLNIVSAGGKTAASNLVVNNVSASDLLGALGQTYYAQLSPFQDFGDSNNQTDFFYDRLEGYQAVREYVTSLPEEQQFNAELVLGHGGVMRGGPEGALEVAQKIANKSAREEELLVQANQAAASGDFDAQSRAMAEYTDLSRKTHVDILEEGIHPGAELLFDVVVDPFHAVGPLSSFTRKLAGLPPAEIARYQRELQRLQAMTPAQVNEALNGAMKKADKVAEKLEDGENLRTLWNTFNPLIETAQSKVDRTTYVVTTQLQHILSKATTKKEAADIVDAFASGKLNRGVYSPANPFADADGFITFSNAQVANEAILRELPTVKQFADDLKKVKELSGEGNLNRVKLLAELEGVTFEQSRKIRGLNRLQGTPAGAAKTTTEAATGGKVIVKYLDVDGNEVGRTAEMLSNDAIAKSKAFNKEVKSRGGNVLYNGIKFVTAADLQKGFLSFNYLNLDSGNWIAQFASQMAPALADRNMTFEPRENVVSWISSKASGIAPDAEIQKIVEGREGVATVGRGGEFLDERGRSVFRFGGRFGGVFDSKYNFLANFDEALSNIWAGDTEIAGVVPWGEKAFRVRIFKTAFERVWNYNWKREINSFSQQLQAGGVPQVVADQFKSKLYDLTQGSTREETFAKLRELIDAEVWTPSLGDLGIDISLSGARSPEIYRDIQSAMESGDAADPQAWKASVDELRQMYEGGDPDLISAAPPQAARHYFTNDEINRDVAEQLDDITQEARNAGVDPTEPVDQMRIVMDRYQQSARRVWQTLQDEFASSSGPEAVDNVIDFWKQWRDAQSSTRQEVDRLGRLAAEQNNPQAWGEKWEGTAKLYEDLSTSLDDLSSQALERFRAGLSPESSTIDDILESYAGFDEATNTAARSEGVGSFRDEGSNARYERTVGAHRAFVDQGRVEMMMAFRTYPSPDALDIVVSAEQDALREGRRIAAELRELRESGVTGDAYARQRDMKWWQYYDNAKLRMNVARLEIVTDGISRQIGQSLTWDDGFSGGQFKLLARTENGNYIARRLDDGTVHEFSPPNANSTPRQQPVPITGAGQRVISDKFGEGEILINATVNKGDPVQYRVRFDSGEEKVVRVSQMRSVDTREVRDSSALPEVPQSIIDVYNQASSPGMRQQVEAIADSVRIPQQPTIDDLRRVAVYSGIGTFTENTNRAYDNHLVNVINKDLGLSLSIRERAAPDSPFGDLTQAQVSIEWRDAFPQGDPVALAGPGLIEQGDQFDYAFSALQGRTVAGVEIGTPEDLANFIVDYNSFEQGANVVRRPDEAGLTYLEDLTDEQLRDAMQALMARSERASPQLESAQADAFQFGGAPSPEARRTAAGLQRRAEELSERIQSLESQRASRPEPQPSDISIGSGRGRNMTVGEADIFFSDELDRLMYLASRPDDKVTAQRARTQLENAGVTQDQWESIGGEIRRLINENMSVFNGKKNVLVGQYDVPRVSRDALTQRAGDTPDAQALEDAVSSSVENLRSQLKQVQDEYAISIQGFRAENPYTPNPAHDTGAFDDVMEQGENLYDTVARRTRGRQSEGNTWQPQSSEISHYQMDQMDAIWDKLLRGREKIVAGVPNQITGPQKQLIQQAIGGIGNMWDDALYASTRAGRDATDFAMLNYEKRRNIDTVMSMISPFHYYASRAPLIWARRMMNKPSIANAYYQWEEAAKLENEQTNQPRRLEGTLPVPGSEQLFGKTLRISNPAHYIFPYSGMVNEFADLGAANNNYERTMRLWERYGYGFSPLLSLATDYGLDKAFPLGGDPDRPQGPDARQAEGSRTQSRQVGDVLQPLRVGGYGYSALTGNLPPAQAGDEYDFGRVGRAVGLEAVDRGLEPYLAGYAKGVLEWMQSNNTRDFDKAMENMIPEAQPHKEEIRDLLTRATKRASADRLLTVSSAMLLNLRLYNDPETEQALRKISQENFSLGYDAYSNPGGSKAAMDAHSDSLYAGTDQTTGDVLSAYRNYSELYPQAYATSEEDDPAIRTVVMEYWREMIPLSESQSKERAAFLAANIDNLDTEEFKALKERQRGERDSIKEKYPSFPERERGQSSTFGENPIEQARTELEGILKYKPPGEPKRPGDGASREVWNQYYADKEAWELSRLSEIQLRMVQKVDDAEGAAPRLSDQPFYTDAIGQYAAELLLGYNNKYNEEIEKLYNLQSEVSRLFNSENIKASNDRVERIKGKKALSLLQQYYDLPAGSDERRQFSKDNPGFGEIYAIAHHPEAWDEARSRFGAGIFALNDSFPRKKDNPSEQEVNLWHLENSAGYGRLRQFWEWRSGLYDSGLKGYEVKPIVEAEAAQRFGEDILSLADSYPSTRKGGTKEQQDAWHIQNSGAYGQLIQYWEWDRQRKENETGRALPPLAGTEEADELIRRGLPPIQPYGTGFEIQQQDLPPASDLRAGSFPPIPGASPPVFSEVQGNTGFGFAPVPPRPDQFIDRQNYLNNVSTGTTTANINPAIQQAAVRAARGENVNPGLAPVQIDPQTLGIQPPTIAEQVDLGSDRVTEVLDQFNRAINADERAKVLRDNPDVAQQISQGASSAGGGGGRQFYGGGRGGRGGGRYGSSAGRGAPYYVPGLGWFVDPYFASGGRQTVYPRDMLSQLWQRTRFLRY